MLSGLPSSTERFLLDLARIQRRQEKAERQVTSGLRIQTASDDPEALGRLLEARAGLDRVAQTQLNLGRVKVEVDTAERALQQAASIMDKARGLGAQGASGHQSATTRQHIAGEMEALLERLVAVSGTAIEGRFLFSGDNDQAPPYQVDLLVPSGVSAYQGSDSTRLVADPSGLAFSTATTAQEIFDSPNPSENVFAAVNGMRRALLAYDNPPNPPDPTIPALSEALANLESSGIYVNQKLAGYGLVQNRVNEAIETAAKMELAHKQQIAGIEEVDLAAAASELTQTRTALEAAFTVRVQTPRKSLFDYIG